MLKIAWHASYAHPLPYGHRFPMLKYELIPAQLIYEGSIIAENLFTPDELSEAAIVATHDLAYWEKLKHQTLTPQEIRRIGFPLSHALVQRERIIMQGTVMCTEFALQHGIALNIAGGTHHACTNRGEGFCLLNDLALAANHLIQNHHLQRILIVDLDVHQGNGTAQIFAHEPRVFTFSMHGDKNYPMHKEHSDLDIALPDGIGDAAYLKQLGEVLPKVFNQFQPQFVLFQSGVDILSSDKLGRLGVSILGCKARDRMVLELCQRNSVPVVCAMGGGYSPDIRQIVEAHANTFRLAQELYF
jgi:acetoin utilization deacetylase AcuC-like enzyme